MEFVRLMTDKIIKMFYWENSICSIHDQSLLVCSIPLYDICKLLFSLVFSLV